MARGEDKYLPARDRGPVRAYVRDVVDSRPHLLGLFMPLALVVVASVLVPVPAVQQYMSLFSLAMLMVMIAEGVYLGLSTTARVRGEVPGRRRERTGHRLVRVHPGDASRGGCGCRSRGSSAGRTRSARRRGSSRRGLRPRAARGRASPAYAGGACFPPDAPVRYLATARRRARRRRVGRRGSPRTAPGGRRRGRRVEGAGRAARLRRAGTVRPRCGGGARCSSTTSPPG